MELLFEIVIEIYVELMMCVVPGENASSKKYRRIAILIATLVLLGTFALFIFGCVLLGDYNNKLGLIPIVISIVISVLQIIAGFILHGKKAKK